MEEELQKRNTDCVYFLASPLTCKKGIKCEYRHSDIARLNPRDCWYWLAGNCLNPTCAFRHPPLDGHSEVSSGSSAVPLHQSSIPMNKTDVPCYFYFGGFCNKGDRCSFSHGSDDSSPSLKPVKATSAVPDALPLDNKTSLGSETKTLPNVTHPNPPETAPKAPLPLQSELNEVSQKPASILKQYSPLQIPTSNGEEAAAVMSESMLPAEGFVQSMSLVCTDESSDEEVDDHSEPEERWESSPGFDVLVDGRTDNFDYEDDLDYPVAFDRDGRELNSHFLGYGFEGQVESDPKLSEEESLYQHRRYDCYDSVDYGHSSDYGQMAPGRLRDRMLDPMLSRKRKLLPVRFAGNGRVGVDLRDHLRNRRGIDNSSSNYLSRRRDSSRLIGQARERSRRHNSGKQLHRRLTSEVGRNMIGSFSGREFLLKGDKGQSWLKHTVLHKSRQPFGERRHRKKQRLASEVSKEPTSTESRCTRESSSFTGPKSLAEIREEGRKAREKMELAQA